MQRSDDRNRQSQYSSDPSRDLPRADMLPTSLTLMDMNKQSFERLAYLFELPITANGVMSVLAALEDGNSESLAQLVEHVETDGCFHQVLASTICRFDQDAPPSLKHALSFVPFDDGPTLEFASIESRVDVEIRWDSPAQIDDEGRDDIWRDVVSITRELGLGGLPRRLSRDATSWDLAMDVTLRYRAPDESPATSEPLAVPTEDHWTPARLQIENFDEVDLRMILRDLGIEAESALGRPVLRHLIDLLTHEELNLELGALEHIQRDMTVEAELRAGIGDAEQVPRRDLDETPGDVLKRMENGWRFTLSNFASDLGPVRLELGSLPQVTRPNGEFLIDRHTSATLSLLGSASDPQGACAAFKLASFLKDRTGEQVDPGNFTQKTAPGETTKHYAYSGDGMRFTVELRTMPHPIRGPVQDS